MPDSRANPGNNPTVVTVFGILMILYSVLSLCCSPLAAIVFVIPEIAQEFPENYDIFMYIMIAISLPLTGYGLVAAIGLLTRKMWARQHTVIWAFACSGYTVIFLISEFALFGMQWKLDQPEDLVGTIFGFLTYLAFFIFYGLTIFFLSRPDIKEFFGR